MLRDYFPLAMSFVMRPDVDGQPYHVTPNDNGGATSWGVTYTTWASWQQMHNAPATMGMFKALGADDFQPLYRAMYWNSCRCGSMTAIGIMIFDAAVNCGPGHAAAFLQHVLQIKIDNQIGPNTIAAYASVDPAVLARALCAEREDFYATRPTAKYFERGWNRRAEMCRDYVLSLLPPPPPPPTSTLIS